MPHGMAGTLGKRGRRPPPSTLFGRCGGRPRHVAPYLVSLGYQPSKAMPADGMVVKIGGKEHVIFTTMCEGTRAPTGCPTVARRGPTTPGGCSAWTFWSGAAFRRW